MNGDDEIKWAYEIAKQQWRNEQGIRALMNDMTDDEATQIRNKWLNYKRETDERLQSYIKPQGDDRMGGQAKGQEQGQAITMPDNMEVRLDNISSSWVGFKPTSKDDEILFRLICNHWTPPVAGSIHGTTRTVAIDAVWQGELLGLISMQVKQGEHAYSTLQADAYRDGYRGVTPMKHTEIRDQIVKLVQGYQHHVYEQEQLAPDKVMESASSLLKTAQELVEQDRQSLILLDSDAIAASGEQVVKLSHDCLELRSKLETLIARHALDSDQIVCITESIKQIHTAIQELQSVPELL